MEVTECEACGALGGTDSNRLCPYREHNICQGCYQNWRRLDQILGREATWEEFLKPGLRMFTHA